MPLVALVLALGLAIYIGARIAPTLLGLVLPPGPPLPMDQVTLLEEKAVSPATHEWNFSSGLRGCEVANYVDQRLSRPGQKETPCFYEVSSGCSPDMTMPDVEGNNSYIVARCYGVQESGQSRVRWSLTITSGHSPAAAQTKIRVFRDATNMQE
jgi:hypothetical protein